jgi:hypothetical protein
MRTHTRVAFLALLAMAGTAWGQQTTVNREHITNSSMVNSSIDATALGATTPATGNFTSLNFGTGLASSTFSVGAGYSQLQLLPNGLPVRRGITWGNDPSGDISFWVNSAENNPTFAFRNGLNGATWAQITAAGFQGSITGTTGNFSGPVSAGALTTSGGLTAQQGATITGTISTNNVTATGTGYFGSGLTAASLTTSGGLIAQQGATITGVITTNNVTATANVTAGSFTGPLSGNASTATNLQSTPSTCGTSGVAYGIGANGAALCNANPGTPTGNANAGWVQLPGGVIYEWGQTSQFDTGPITVNFPRAFPNQCLNVQISDTTASASARIWEAGSYTTTGFQAHNDGFGQGSWFAIGN